MSNKPQLQTLARIAGLSPLPSLPEKSVLLMIDPQREYTEGLLPLAGVDAAVEEGAHLLAFARAEGMPLIHVIHHGRPGAAATATRDLPHPFGAGITPAKIIQAGTLAALSDRFSIVIQDTGALRAAARHAA